MNMHFQSPGTWTDCNKNTMNLWYQSSIIRLLLRLWFEDIWGILAYPNSFFHRIYLKHNNRTSLARIVAQFWVRAIRQSISLLVGATKISLNGFQKTPKHAKSQQGVQSTHVPRYGKNPILFYLTLWSTACQGCGFTGSWILKTRGVAPGRAPLDAGKSLLWHQCLKCVSECIHFMIPGGVSFGLRRVVSLKWGMIYPSVMETCVCFVSNYRTRQRSPAQGPIERE